MSPLISAQRVATLVGEFPRSPAYLGLAVWSIVTLFPAVDQHAFGCRLSTGMPARFLAVFALAITAMNAVVWLSAIVPALLDSHPASLMKGTGLLTNPVYVRDLAIWLPLLTAAAVGCWHRRAWGLLVTGAMLVMFTTVGELRLRLRVTV